MASLYKSPHFMGLCKRHQIISELERKIIFGLKKRKESSTFSMYRLQSKKFRDGPNDLDGRGSETLSPCAFPATLSGGQVKFTCLSLTTSCRAVVCINPLNKSSGEDSNHFCSLILQTTILLFPPTHLYYFAGIEGEALPFKHSFYKNC